jgi:hypothetical protein
MYGPRPKQQERGQQNHNPRPGRNVHTAVGPHGGLAAESLSATNHAACRHEMPQVRGSYLAVPARLDCAAKDFSFVRVADDNQRRHQRAVAPG